MKEEWKILDEFPMYEISNTGKVRNKKTKKEKKQRINKKGNYEVSIINKNDIQKVMNISKLVAMCFLKNPKNYNLVYHKDGNKLNNSINNLVWKTDKNRYEIKEDYVIGYDINDNKFYIDLDDYEKVKQYQWYKDDKGYFMNNKLKIRLHNFIMNDKFIDHINRNKSDNRKYNLRKCTTLENNINRSIMKSNTSNFIGVSKGKYSKRKGNTWRAYIGINKKYITLGSYHNLKDAIKARLKAEKEYFGEFAPQRHLFKEYEIE